jgi:hypothetical protein
MITGKLDEEQEQTQMIYDVLYSDSTVRLNQHMLNSKVKKTDSTFICC